MNNLKSQFPNLSEILDDATSVHKGGFKSDNGSCLVYMMPVFTFGHHTGDNYFELEKKVNGFIFSVVSKRGAKEIIRTSSHEIFEDLSHEEWDRFVNDMFMKHAVKPEYPAFAAGKLAKIQERQLTGKGCLISLLFLTMTLMMLIFFIM